MRSKKVALLRVAAFVCLLSPLSLADVHLVDADISSPSDQRSDDTPKLPALIGTSAPNLRVTSLDGKPVSLADYRGKAVLLNFWATWCGACRQEMPWLAQLREQYRKEGFEVLGVVTDKATPQKLAEIQVKYGVHYPILTCNHQAAVAYGGLPYLPETFFIDRHGRVVAELADASSRAELEENILKALRRR